MPNARFVFMRRFFWYVDARSVLQCFFPDRRTDLEAQRHLAQLAEAVLRRGIMVGSTLYEFALTSASSIRESSAWFFCGQGAIRDAHALRRRLGDFSRLPPEKIAGRLGQAFSQTLGGIRLDDISVVGVCDDVLNLYGYNFTDGVGRISPQYACKLCEALGLMNTEDVPSDEMWSSLETRRRTIKMFLRKGKLKSAFQIRFGGTKGMLVLDPELPQNGKHILLRPSMIKFPSPLCHLEVCKVSQSVSGRLNSEFLRVLDCMGTQHEAILERASDELREAQEMLHDPLSALNYLRSHNDPYLTPAIEMLLAGMPVDSFLTSIIADMHKHRIGTIQNGHIPVQRSRFAFGVIDELGILAEDEIFYQFSGDNEITPLEVPKVIVSKNPCRHPGDMRIMRSKVRRSLASMHSSLSDPLPVCPGLVSFGRCDRIPSKGQPTGH
jgi:RNA-dependent RNA polymerase